MPGSEKQIERYCRDGDPKSFQRFFDEQAPRLWRFLVARGCDRDTAYDLVSESFLRFVQVVCNDPSSPVALLYRIALNLRIDLFRHQQASPLVADPEGEADAPVHDETERAIYTRQLLATLHPDEQNLLLMRYWIGLTHKEIADVLGLPEGTVRRQAAAALKKLQGRWEP